MPESSELVLGMMSLSLIRATSLAGLYRATSISCGNEDPAEAEREKEREMEAEGGGHRRESQY